MLPWIEKYRPSELEDIILDKKYKILFDTIVDNLDFPHLLFYGPPGSGKTTTIVCLIHKIIKKYNMKHNIIHLNASDERGIDIIRNTIYTFVNSNNIYNSINKKFIILDEVDSMTKNAQQSLLTLFNNENVHFCLICNYISKLIPTIRNSTLTINFCNIENYRSYINNIIQKENIKIDDTIINDILYNYYPDLRSIVNALQSYTYLNTNFIKQKYIINICKTKNFSNLKKYIKIFHKNDFLCKLFLHIVEEYKTDETLILYMKEIIFHDLDIDFIEYVFMEYFFKLQN